MGEKKGASRYCSVEDWWVLAEKRKETAAGDGENKNKTKLSDQEALFLKSKSDSRLIQMLYMPRGSCPGGGDEHEMLKNFVNSDQGIFIAPVQEMRKASS